jgi:hypothetical protein
MGGSMKNVIINLVIILLISSIGLSAQQSDTRTITVTGEGEIAIRPEKQVIRIPIISLSEDLEEAKTDNDSRLSAIEDILELFSIDDENMEIRNFEVRSSDERTAKPGKEKTYKVMREVLIAVEAGDIKEELIDALINAGLDSFNASGYIYPGKQEYVRKAYLKAVENAGWNAREMAKALGLKTGRILSIKEGRPDGRLNPDDDDDEIMHRYVKTENSGLNGEVRLLVTVTVQIELQN